MIHNSQNDGTEWNDGGCDHGMELMWGLLVWLQLWLNVNAYKMTLFNVSAS